MPELYISILEKIEEVSYGDFGIYLELNLEQATDQQLKLREVKARSSECALCALICDFIKRAGAMKDELLDRRIILSDFCDERARGPHSAWRGAFTNEINDQRARNEQGYIPVSWIDGIRVSFADYDTTDLEKNYPLLSLYMPLVRAPGKQVFLSRCCTAYMYSFPLNCVKLVGSILTGVLKIHLLWIYVNPSDTLGPTRQ